jgi:hypothetical protein
MSASNEQAPAISTALLRRYFTEYFGAPVEVAGIEPLGEDDSVKGFGYGAPTRVLLDGAPVESAVIHFAGSHGFGHDTLADHAVEALVPYETFNSLRGHVPALDVGIVDGEGELRSLREVRDFFWVTGWAGGALYHKDLDRILRTGELTVVDEARAETLANTLADIHADRHDDPERYTRRTRELVGGNECIAGLLDSYDAYDLGGYSTPAEMRRIEHLCVDWRSRLKWREHRLCRVHGDFHPWNILFEKHGALSLLDRSRGEWGEPADDVAALAINYLFYGMRRGERAFDGPFALLWRRFFSRYLDRTDDRELAEVIAPYLAWRGLVVASPLWYPDIDVAVRRRLFRFITRVLEQPVFDWEGVGALLEDPR